MSVDELRAGFSRLAGDVVPDPDPFERLLSRKRKRLRHRIGGLLAASAAVVATAVAAPLTLQATSKTPTITGYLVESAWTWKLLDAPTRGNLDPRYVDELKRAFDRGPLPHTKILFAFQNHQVIQVVVAYHSDTHAYVVARAAEPGTSASALARQRDEQVMPAAPFLVTYSEIDAVRGGFVGLAPPGCEIGTSVHATIGADGSWKRTFRPAPDRDWVINPTDSPAQFWQVTCDGKVRETRPARPIHEVSGENYSMVGPDQGTADRATVEAAAKAFHTLRFATGVGDSPALLWGGQIPGILEPAVLLGPLDGPGLLALNFGTNPNSMIALEPQGSHVLPTTPPQAGLSITSTGVTFGEGVIAIRVPVRDGTRAVLSNRVLIVAPQQETHVEALDGTGKLIASGALYRGVGVLTFEMGLAARVRAGAWEAIFADHADGPRIFGDRLVYDWK